MYARKAMFCWGINTQEHLNCNSLACSTNIKGVIHVTTQVLFAPAMVTMCSFVDTDSVTVLSIELLQLVRCQIFEVILVLTNLEREN